MYELIQARGKTYYIDCPAKIGVYLSGENEVWLIDSGSDKDTGRRVNKIITERGWQIKGAAVSHSHADHIGGLADIKKRSGCLVLSEGIERAVTENPLLEPTYLYGGFPAKALRNKFLMAAATKVDSGFDQLPQGLEAIPLPGHSFEMAGFMTSDGVLFAADAVFSKSTIEKYHVNFVYDIEAHLQSLDRLEATEAELFVPSHAEQARDIRPLVRLNRDKVFEIIELLERACVSPTRFDAVLRQVFNHYELSLDMNQYVLVGSTLRSYMSYLVGQARIDTVIEDNRLLYVRI